MAEKHKQSAAQSSRPTLRQRIRAARGVVGQSQVNLAVAAGISQRYLSQLETDEREPTLSIAARLAKALDNSLDELASGVTKLELFNPDAPTKQIPKTPSLALQASMRGVLGNIAITSCHNSGCGNLPSFRE